jgi:protein gp37
MSKTKIPWTDEVWNPAWGCLNKCPYCYARSIAKRFGKTQEEIDFAPTWKESNFNRKFAKATKRVFVNSMSDIMYWKAEWMEKVIDRIKAMPHIQFIFLTKGGYLPYTPYVFPDNVICGITATTASELPAPLDWRMSICKTWLLNIEPLAGYFLPDREMKEYINSFQWIIIGVETGSRRNKYIPGYLEVATFGHAKVNVFMKPSLDYLYTPHFPEWEKSMRVIIPWGMVRRAEFIGDTVVPWIQCET